MTEEKAVAVRPKADAPAEWGTRTEIAALADRFAVMLPGAKDMTRDEVLTAAQYCRTMDLNPFRGEVYFYKSRGKLCVVDGYKALARWAQNKARYTDWDEDLELTDGQIAHIRVWILRDDRKEMLDKFIELGAQFDQAIKMAAHYADGTVTKGDTLTRNGEKKDPPVGWTWRDVARKRAFKNALNLSHGAPSPREIAEISWEVNGVKTLPSDWDGAEELSGYEAEQLAMLRAQDRDRQQAWQALTPDQQQARLNENVELLRGNHDPDDPYNLDSTTATTMPMWDEAVAAAGEEAEPEGYTPEQLLAEVNEATGNYYRHVKHLYNGIKLELGEGWIWPPPDDAPAWTRAKEVAIEHTKKQPA